MNEERKNELKEAMLAELEEWWYRVDFNFVVENLIGDETISEVNMDDNNAYDEIYETLSEAIAESFRTRFC